MNGRVTVTVELYDDGGPNDQAGGETVRWGRRLNDANPRFSASELEKALTEGTAALVGKVARLRGDIRVDDAAVADTLRVEHWPPITGSRD